MCASANLAESRGQVLSFTISRTYEHARVAAKRVAPDSIDYRDPRSVNYLDRSHRRSRRRVSAKPRRFRMGLQGQGCDSARVGSGGTPRMEIIPLPQSSAV